jgi:hypothetical protein
MSRRSDTGVQGGTELVDCGRIVLPLLGRDYQVTRLEVRQVERRISRRIGCCVEG